MRQLAAGHPAAPLPPHDGAAPAAARVDLRTTLRLAQRSGGLSGPAGPAPAALRHRRLVVLCDISGSMEPYARALLQLLYCAARRRPGRRCSPSPPG